MQKHTWQVALLASLVGAILGGAFVAFLSQGRDGDPLPVERAEWRDNLSGTLLELKGAIEQLDRSLSTIGRVAPGVGGPAREPVAGAPTLETAIRELTEALASSTSVPVVSTADAAPMVRNSAAPRRAELFPAARLAMGDSEERNWASQFGSQYLLWSYQEVLNAFGPPDDISVSKTGIERWNYRSEIDGLKIYTSFEFYRGHVTRIRG